MNGTGNRWETDVEREVLARSLTMDGFEGNVMENKKKEIKKENN